MGVKSLLFLGMGKKNRSNKKKGNRSKSRSASPPPPPKKKPEPVAAPAPVEAVEAPVVEAPVAAPAPAVEPVPPKAAVVDVDNLQKEPEKPAVVAPSPAAPAPAPAPAPTPAPEVTSAPSPAAPVPVSSTEAVGTTAATTVQPATSETQETTPISPLVQEALVSPAAETSVSVALPGQPGSQAVAPEATPVANNKTTTTTTTTTTTALNTSTNTSTMSNPRVTFEHLNLIEQAGAATNQEDTQTAVADMHAKIKEAEGNLGSLNANQYAFTFTPLKEAIWFQRKGQFAIGTETNWTLCKLFHAVKHNASTLSTLNLPLVDLEDVPNDTTIDSWKTLGYKFENELHNIAFFQCLEALYELVELDSTSTNPNTERRNQLFHRVASFVKIGSRQCFETATPQASSVAPTEPPRFSFQMILKIFEKLQQVGPRADPTGFDWDTMGIDAKDGVEVWKSLATCKRLNLPRQVWWKVLFVLVFDLEPHLLRMNLQLLDKEAIKSFQDFLDDAVEPPQQSKNVFYKNMIAQVMLLQKQLLTSVPPRENVDILATLDRIFTRGENTVYSPTVMEDIKPLPAPMPTPMPAPAPTEATLAPTPALAPAPAEVEHGPVPKEITIARENSASRLSVLDPYYHDKMINTKETTPALVSHTPATVPEPTPAPAPATTSISEPAPAPAPIAVAAPPPVSTPSSIPPIPQPPPKLTSTAAAGTAPSPTPIKSNKLGAGTGTGTVPKSPARNPFTGMSTLETAPSGDSASLTNAMTQLNQEEALMDLMRQAATVLDAISTEKRDLITKERRAVRNLQSAQDNLEALKAVNEGLLKENASQKDEIYQREDDINKLQAEAKKAAQDHADLKAYNQQLLAHIEELNQHISGLAGEKEIVEKNLSESKTEASNLAQSLETSQNHSKSLREQLDAEKSARAAVDKNLATMKHDKEVLEGQLRNTSELLEEANEEIDRLEEIQAEQERKEAEKRREQMEARRRELERAEQEALESLRRAEDMRKTKAQARANRRARSSAASIGPDSVGPL